MTEKGQMVALVDLLERFEWEKMARNDKQPAYHLEECWFCGRPFNARGSQSRCRRRDCVHALETPEQRTERARQQEIAMLAELQQQEMKQDRRQPSMRNLTPYDATRKQVTRSESIVMALRLEANPNLREGLSGAKTPKYLVEWLDPTFDEAVIEIEKWMEKRQRRKRTGPQSFPAVRGQADELIVGFSKGRTFARR